MTVTRNSEHFFAYIPHVIKSAVPPLLMRCISARASSWNISSEGHRYQFEPAKWASLQGLIRHFWPRRYPILHLEVRRVEHAG